MRKFAITIALVAVLSTCLSAQTKTGSATSKQATSAPITRVAQTRPVPVKATLAGAKKLYWTGKYAQAAGMYKTLSANPAKAVPASLGLSEAYAAVGKYDEAIAALRAVSARAEKNAVWHVQMSSLLDETGKYDEALSAARKAFKLRDDWTPAVLRLGQALEIPGKKAEAIKAYKAIEKALAREDFTKDAESLVAAGKILDRYAILTGQKASEQARNILHNYLQKAYQGVDKKYWPANVAAGMFLLSKHKPKPAMQEFNLALRINSRIPDVYIGKGVTLLQRWRFEQAISEVEKALKINPNCADAYILKAATLFRWRKFDQVAPVIEKALKVNPNNIEALSLMAALHVRTLNPDKAEPFIKRVEKINPQCAGLYETIAQWLSAARQFDQAEKYFKKAIKLAPESAGAVTGLGQLYMQTGREKLASETLDKAFKLDDYRQDVVRYVNLLAKLKKYQVKETEHFIVKVDGEKDAVLLDLLAQEAERIYPEICKDFDFEPKEKTLVEMFSSHGDFSVRISGRGWINTVGACTGRVIGMPAPDPLRSGMGAFNWAVVLRHEFTHTVTLTATKNRIPHWFTESCAVWEQPDRRNYQAVGLLVSAVRSKKLYPIKELSWGFIRPDRRKRGQGARTLAYAQSEWIFEYIVESTKDYNTIIRMLNGFRDGWTQAKVFKEVLGTTEEQFDKDFRAWAIKQVESWGFDPKPQPRMRAAAARKILKTKPKDPRALAVVGSDLLRQKKYGEAIAIARRLEEVKPRSPEAAAILAECYLAKRRWPEAIAALESYKVRRRLAPYGYKKLAKLYMQMGQAEKALPNLIELHRRTMKDPKYARQIADIYRTAGKNEQTLYYYNQVLNINPYDAGVHKAMAELHVLGSNYGLAIRSMRNTCLIDPKNADSWTQLAMVYYRAARVSKKSEQLSQARVAAQKAIELDPQSQAKDVLQMIDEYSNQ